MYSTKLFRLSFFAIAILSIVSCPSKHNEKIKQAVAQNTDNSTPVILHIYNWENYMPSQIIQNFEAETGIKVEITTYQSNEEMYQNLIDNNNRVDPDNKEHYDLVVPSSYYVQRLAKKGALQPIDKSKLSNFEQLNPALLNLSIDPNNTYSVPYLWGTTGIAYNNQTINSQEITGWNDLWRDEFKNKVILSDDMREVFGMTLMTLGYSSNSEDPKQIKSAYQKLTTLMPNVVSFNTYNTRKSMLESKAQVCMIWNGEIFNAQRTQQTQLTYVYPKEGAILWTDNFVIPKDAEHADAAHQFINFVLRAENGQLISDELGYATPNMGARIFMNEKMKKDTNIYPTAEQLKKSESQRSINDDALKLYQNYWDKLIELHRETHL